ncbi:MAG: hypothetical protein WCL04_08290 [Verrucomicrobiota bacterium]
MKTLRLLPLLLLLAAPLFGQSTIQFNGVVVSGGKVRVSLLDQDTGHAGWVTIGARFGDYIVTAYLPAPPPTAGVTGQKDCIVLTRESDGQVQPPIGLNEVSLP